MNASGWYEEHYAAVRCRGGGCPELAPAGRSTAGTYRHVASPCTAVQGPRLPRLTDILAPIEVSVTAVDEPPNLKRSPFDLCLFYTDRLGRGQRKFDNART